ncbi:MAG: LamG-like jellyroll fold domain-containing protein [Akkermansia sp.]
MNKTLPTLLLSLASSCAFATTSLPDTLHTELKYWWDFETSEQPVDYSTGNPVSKANEWEADFGWEKNTGYGQLGNNKANGDLQHPWKSSDINDHQGEPEPNPTEGFNLKIDQFTISFDIKDLSSDIDGSIFSIYTNDPNVTNNTLSLKKAEGDNTKLTLGLSGGNQGGNITTNYDPTAWTNFTITCTSNQITFYKDGQVIDTIAAVVGSNSITGIQFGKDWGWANQNPDQAVDKHFINSAKLDNIGIWNKALSTDEVKELNGLPTNSAVPEPTTATLSLLGLASLLMRRRRRA